MPIIDLLLAVSLGFLAVLLLGKATYSQQRQLEDSFYQLLESENSCISLIQLAATARVEPEKARQYLEHQAQVFNAVPEVDADGDTFYRFPKLHRRPSADI
ncbi:MULTISPECIES: hypothetical protein [unclassified Coleofasciculus]|uniref:hypothetical protein n=1 Tax=unclassified Coleofasciculus TaxID=2692782 RepID=UPI001881519D|nr:MULTISPECIES: hypothetical protein [unclassified Coleofasciculus]MBE9129784.1 hypothetical protein [Coleofasciculus sp. LEGE 07081]MBE9152244.1 hypothetical protein [Coleofasciculus sp. LEGE 07092]